MRRLKDKKFTHVLQIAYEYLKSVKEVSKIEGGYTGAPHEFTGINETIKKSIEESSIIFTDQSTSYVDIARLVEVHISEKSTKQTTKETLKWVHIFISNAKRNLLGNYHKIKRKNLQLYLDEFVYKLNRRYFGEKIFDRLVIASITAV